MKNYNVDKLQVKIMDTREEMGKVAGDDIAAKIVELLKEKEYINIIFAAAPSQNETLASLLEHKEIDWTRINAFHMDEYIGLPSNSTAKFGQYLNDHIFGLAPFRSINYINTAVKSIEEECDRYSELLKKFPPDIVCMGIGENGHIAFNDPPVADFNDPKMAKPVALDMTCRIQQVNDKCFKTLDEVPKYAITLTVPTLFNAGHLFCSVPAITKAAATKEMLTTDKIDEHCPATILRRHNSAILYLDSQSASEL